MAFPCGAFATMATAALLFLSMGVVGYAQVSLSADFTPWTTNVHFARDGLGLELVLDRLSASGAGSKRNYLFGGFGVWMKLPPRDSSGTVTTFYMSSPGPRHCEFDFEFLGNRTGKPFLLHTNIFVDGVGGREQQIYLGFDPSASFHYYSLQWNRNVLVFYVDDTPIRMYRNLPRVAYPGSKPMGLFLSIWDGSTWATQGGRIPIDWDAAPFVATYQNFRMNGCEVKANDRNGVTACQRSRQALGSALGMARIRQMRAVRANQVVYNYCDDRRRYPTTPPECVHNVL